jgi:hypothetical protein
MFISSSVIGQKNQACDRLHGRNVHEHADASHPTLLPALPPAKLPRRRAA